MKVIEKLKNDPLMPIRHTAEHVLHTAMQELYPNLKKVMGPPIEDGFYFDFDLNDKISVDDFPKIEALMKEIIDADLPIKHVNSSAEEAREIFKNNPYKLATIDEIVSRSEEVGLYEMGSKGDKHYDLDLCAGPHAKSTGEVKAFKLLSVAGAYYKGDENNKMLQRIYGTAFSSQKDLDHYLEMLEEAKKRDHRKLARELDLIVFSDIVGSGLPLYTPKGAHLRSEVYNFSRKLNKEIGYEETYLPGINRGELFKISGHYDKYKDDMFTVHSHYTEDEYFLKPMNCPQHCVIFGSRPRSYRDLPLRFADFSVLYRDEKPGEINGILRSRAFTQDDGHGFIREDQIGSEFANVLSAVKKALEVYGFEYWIRLSLRDPNNKQKYLGDDAVWEKAESQLMQMTKELNLSVVEAPGEAAIYGPKLDFMAVDALGREWQISTIQLDMIMPTRFGLVYTDKNGEQKAPFMIHRAIIGSERFIAIIIEHFAGAFPVWLSPVQVQIIPIGEKHVEYANKVAGQLKDKGIRVEVDDRDETMQSKIRAAQVQKVPYMIVLGDREVENNQVSVRLRTGESHNGLATEEVLKKIEEINLTKSLNLW